MCGTTLSGIWVKDNGARELAQIAVGDTHKRTRESKYDYGVEEDEKDEPKTIISFLRRDRDRAS